MLDGLLRAMRSRKADPAPLEATGQGSGIGRAILTMLGAAGPQDDGLAAGIQVDEWKALNLSAVWCAQRVIAEAVAMLPLTLVKWDAKADDRRELDSHPAARLLAEQPNPEMPVYAFKETLTHHICGWGNGYAEIERAESGRPLALWPITPDRVTPERDGAGNIGYWIDEPDGGQVRIPADDMLHIPGLGWDGIVGYSVVGFMRNSLGLSLAAERYGSSWFGNGGRPSGVLEHPGKLKEPAKDNLRKSWMRIHGGVSGANRVAILEEGMKYTPISIPPGDSQFLETRKFQVSEIARWFRVPLHLLYEAMGGVSGATVENMGREFVNFTLMPWLTRWVEHARMKLLSKREKDLGYFFEFSLKKLLEADMLTRYRCYAIGRQWGFESPNTIMAAEGRPRIDQEDSDKYLAPMNMSGSLGGDLKPQSDPQTDSAAGGAG